MNQNSQCLMFLENSLNMSELFEKNTMILLNNEFKKKLQYIFK